MRRDCGKLRLLIEVAIIYMNHIGLIKWNCLIYNKNEEKMISSFGWAVILALCWGTRCEGGRRKGMGSFCFGENRTFPLFKCQRNLDELKKQTNLRQSQPKQAPTAFLSRSDPTHPQNPVILHQIYQWNIQSQHYKVIAMKQQRRKHELLTNIELLVQQLKLREKIPKEEMVYLLGRVSLLVKNQPNLLRLASPINIVGDIHGQFYDLLNIFDLYSAPPRRQYLFLGDFIDRGTYSIEVITLLFAYKLKFPQSIHLIRGNHESRCMTTNFNFREECLEKYSEDVYELIMKLFDELPICAIVDQKFFAVHAGISPSCQTLEQIQQINRFEEIPESGGLCDLVWSDPSDQLTTKWQENENRRCSYYFGVNQAKSFLNRNNLKMIIRGHEMQPQGYKYQKILNLPLTLTIFSAPNYSNHNKASIAQITNGELQIKVFGEAEKPVKLPHCMNVFQWSFPFISQSTEQVINGLIKMRATNDRKLLEIVESKEAFVKDYETMRNACLVERVLKLKPNSDNDLKLFDQSYPKLKKSNSKELVGNLRRSRPKAASAKVIGPKLQQNMHKIGCIEAADEDEKDLLEM